MELVFDKKAERERMKKEQAKLDRMELAARYDVATQDRSLGDRWVNMSNALTRAAHGLTLAEKRIIMAAVSKLDSLKAPHPGQKIPTTKITAAEYAELAGCEAPAAYEALQTAAKNLYRRSIVIFEPSFIRKNQKIGDKGTVTYMRWVGRATYHDKEGWIELDWWYEILPHLLGLKKNFTGYQLQQVNAMRSIYSWRLLELLMRFKSTGKAIYTIEDFCTSMEATEKQRADFGKIRTKIIEPAVKELQEKQGWMIQWHPVLAGRKVKAVHFDFIPDTQNKLPSDGELLPEQEQETGPENYQGDQ